MSILILAILLMGAVSCLLVRSQRPGRGDLLRGASTCLVAMALSSFACTEAPEEILEPLGLPVDIRLNTVPPGALPPEGDHVALAAYQDGSGGEWMLMAGSNGAYTATVRHDGYGVAFACVETDVFGTVRTTGRAHYRTVTEDTVINDFSCFPESRESKVLAGSATGLRAGEYGTIQARSDFPAHVEVDNSFRLFAPQQAVTTWGVVRRDGFTGPISRIVRGPDLAMPRPSSIALDFAGAQEPISQSLEAPKNFGSTFVSTTEIYNSNGTALVLPATDTSYVSPPRSQLRRGDTICVSTSEYYASSRRRMDYTCIGEPTPIRVELPRTAPSMGPLHAPSASPRLPRFVVSREGSKFPILEYEFFIQSSTPQRTINLTIRASGSWMSSERAPCGFPDLSAYPGYLPSLELPVGTPMHWDATRIEQSTRDIVPGHTTKNAWTSGSLTLE